MKQSLVTALLIACVASGCSKSSTRPMLPPVQVAVATTPVAALQALGLALDARDTTAYRELFTTDYVFRLDPRDPAFFEWPGPVLTRSDELIAAAHMFRVGNQTVAAANRIEVTWLDSLIAFPDGRPGKTSPYHAMIATRGRILADLGDAILDISDPQVFYLVRGDSAQIPPELGVAADSTRWFIERWEDYALASPAAWEHARNARPAQTTPGSRKLWGSLKKLYLPD